MKMFRALFLLLGLAALPACATSGAQGDAQPQPIRAAAAIEAPAPFVATPTVTAPLPRSFVVHFDSNSADIRASAMQIIYEASQVAGVVKPATIRIHGFADGSGKKAYNQNLSERRAKSVATQLSKLGVKVAVETKGFGEAKAKGKGKSRDARRVEIVLEGGDQSASIANTATDKVATLSAPAAPQAVISPQVALQTAGKSAIKLDRVQMGTAWLPPAQSGESRAPDGWPSGLRHRS